MGGIGLRERCVSGDHGLREGCVSGGSRLKRKVCQRGISTSKRGVSAAGHGSTLLGLQREKLKIHIDDYGDGHSVIGG